MSAPIRTAVLGYGLAGKVFHCPFVTAVPGLQLSAIVARSGDAAAQAYPDARILRSVDDAFADPNLDLIVVGTPSDTHFDLAKAALEAGKHVVIDKPFTATSAQARELITLASARRLVLAPFHNRRFDGDFLTVRKLLAESTLGRVVTIESRFDRFRPLQRTGTWKEASGPANGMLFDLGPHLLDQAVALFGTPGTITANIRTDRDRSDIDDAFTVTLDYHATAEASALRYTCHATMLAADPSPRFLAHGTRGSYRKFGVDPQEPAVVSGTRPPHMDDPTPWLPEQESAWGTLTLAEDLSDPNQPPRLTQRPLPTVPGDYRAFYASVRDAILGAAPLAIPAEDGFTVIRLLELARESSRLATTLPFTASEPR